MAQKKRPKTIIVNAEYKGKPQHNHFQEWWAHSKTGRVYIEPKDNQSNIIKQTTQCHEKKVDAGANSFETTWLDAPYRSTHSWGSFSQDVVCYQLHIVITTFVAYLCREP